MNAVFLLSGGLDSLVLLAHRRPDYSYVHCVGFRYGQRHVRELRHAYQIAHYYGATFEEVSLPRLAGSALTGDGDVPKGMHYSNPVQSATVVPNRNLVMLSVAASIAVSRSAGEVFIGAHAGDAAIYPDCRPEFVAAADATLKLACGVGVQAPFLKMTKREIVALGCQLNAPLDLAYSCYEGGERPCGQCGACLERAEAMR